MKNRAPLKGKWGTYIPAPPDGDGLKAARIRRMVSDVVLVRLDEFQEKAGSLELAPQSIANGKIAVQTGRIMAMGDACFRRNIKNTGPFGENPPVVGDYVRFTIHAGSDGEIEGEDGHRYRMMTDNCIVAVADDGSED